MDHRGYPIIINPVEQFLINHKDIAFIEHFDMPVVYLLVVVGNMKQSMQFCS